MAWRGVARNFMLIITRRGKAWHGMAWQGPAWRGKEFHIPYLIVLWFRTNAWLGRAWHGTAWQGPAWQGMARILN